MDSDRRCEGKIARQKGHSLHGTTMNVQMTISKSFWSPSGHSRIFAVELTGSHDEDERDRREAMSG